MLACIELITFETPAGRKLHHDSMIMNDVLCFLPLFYSAFICFHHVSSDNSTTYITSTPIPASECPNITGNVMLLPSFGLGMSAPANSAEVLTDRKDDVTYRTWRLFHIYGGAVVPKGPGVFVHNYCHDCYLFSICQKIFKKYSKLGDQSHTETLCCREMGKAKQMILLTLITGH